MSQLHPFIEFPKYLYHASKAPRIVHNAADERLARAGDPNIPGEDGGYSDAYTHQDKEHTKAELAAKAGGVYDEATDTVIFPKEA